MGSPDLDAALDAARHADEWAVTVLFRAFQPQLIRYLRHHAPSVAEDLASETWLATAKGMVGFEGDSDDFRAWLFTIARRRMVDHYRRQSRTVPTTDVGDEREPDAYDQVGDAVVDALTSQEAIDALVRDLSPDQAEVVLLRVVADLGVEQVAAIMNRSPGSVRVLQHRALRMLAKSWADSAVTK